MRLVSQLATLSVALLVLAGCGDDSPTQTASGNSLTATVNGTAFTATLAIQATRTAQLLAIGGQDASVKQIQLRILNPSTTGTFPIGAGSTNFATYSEVANVWTSNVIGGTGSITLTTLTANRAVGTFSFTGVPAGSATGTRQVTNGSFDVKF